jgi:general secretion pathway protein I
MPGRRRGFTLLEVLVAVVVLGIALTALLSTQAGGVRLRSQAEAITTATFLLQERMAQQELDDYFPEPGTRDGDFGSAYPGYRWEVTVSQVPVPGAEGQDLLREVRLAVLWRDGRREERLELTSYRANPTVR